jgi:hypothetical protein
VSEFTDLRDRLEATAAERDRAARDQARARNRELAIDQRLAARVRVEGERGAGARELAKARREASRAALSAREELDRQRTSQLEVLREFAKLADPRERIDELSDDVPILLFPLRLETRFKDVDVGGDTRHQLWVRAYPDTCLVDTFEEELSVTEVQSTRRYWQGVWRTAGAEEGRRAAWRDLVASHGSGRGRWLIEHHAPSNPGDQPDEVEEKTVVLVLAVDESVKPDERKALAEIWTAVWRAGGDPAQEEEQFEKLGEELGDEERAAALREATRPLGLTDPPPPEVSREDTSVEVPVAVFPGVPDARPQSWSQPAQVHILPERLLCVVDVAGGPIERLGEAIPTPLQVGPDPSGQPELRPEENGDLVVPDELLWMTDFDRAVEAGLGFRVDLTTDQLLAGVDRVSVLGVRLGADPEKGRLLLEELIAHHRDGRSGFELIAQGTPTNNTEDAESGFTRSDDADATFDLLNGAGLPQADRAERLDGSWLADWLGIDPSVVAPVQGAHGTDQREARAMNVALWPATLGYFLETMMAPVFGSRTVEDIRWFLLDYVSGRGAVPPIRIGRQPYGILPATALARVRPLVDDERHGRFLGRFMGVLRTVDDDWGEFAEQVTSLGRPGSDPDADLLDVLGLHPASAEFHFRYAESLDHIFNQANLFGLGGQFFGALAGAQLDAAALQLLQQLGYTGDKPEILNKYFLGRQGELLGDLVDDRPPSETELVRVWTTAGTNYLEWLATTAQSSMDDLRRQTGFIDGRPPTALLYLLLRHGLLLGYNDAAVKVHRTAQVPEQTLVAMKREPAFVHVAAKGPSESRLAPLMKVDQAITGNPQITVAEHITELIGRSDETAHLTEQIEALRLLAGVPTARLERLLTEHVDICTYRFDSWRLGVVHHQLEGMRARAERGIHLGAYGVLEDLQPSGAIRARVRLKGDLAEVFASKDEPPLERDSRNGGFVHAPSLDHAVTAAVLRAGYLSNASQSDADMLAVNLSSERVRLAMATLEGMRNGQSLGALLGYRLERGLHDRHAPLELDRFIQPLRKAFPLVADRLATTVTDPDVPIEEVAARNVVDGLRVVEHVNAHPGPYPFGKHLPSDATAAERAAIEEEVERLRDVNDAIADLTLAESVHQAVQGRYDASAAALETVQTGAYPPEPDVVRTPRSGIALTHRLALQLDPDATVAADATPRATAEPRLDRWLGELLPKLDDVACRVTWPGGAATVTLADLELRPLDVLPLAHRSDGQAMTELDDRVIARVRETEAVPLTAELAIAYLDPIPDKLRVFEIAPLVRRLRSLVSRARPLRAGDAVPAAEATQATESDVALDRARVDGPLATLETVRSDLDDHVAAIQAMLDDLDARRQDLLDGIDGLVDDTAALFGRAARFGVGQTGWGFAYASRRQLAVDLIARVAARVEVWEARLEDFDALVDEYDELPVGTQEPERVRLLRRAEISVSSEVAEQPPDLDDLRDALPPRRTAFEDRRAAVAAIVADPPATLSGLLAAVQAQLPLTQFDFEPFDLEDEAARVVTLAGELIAAVRAVAADVAARATAAAAALAEHDAAADAPARVEALTKGARALFGEEFVVLPDFGVSATHAAEWTNAQAAWDGGNLTRHATGTLGVEFPIDDWLTGVARVREPARTWEQAVLQAGAFDRAEPPLTSIQLPFVADDHWLALEFPRAEAVLDRDRLVFTAHLPAGFDPAARRCGLLLDDWTEVIPGETENTGIAAHYDRPSSEPPQTLLLVAPAAVTGKWQWEDVTGALDDTLGLARKRAVEPVHVDASAYARFLPATVMATTTHGVSIGLALAVNNNVAQAVTQGGGGGG